jgi:hypothetical protein
VIAPRLGVAATAAAWTAIVLSAPATATSATSRGVTVVTIRAAAGRHAQAWFAVPAPAVGRGERLVATVRPTASVPPPIALDDVAFRPERWVRATVGPVAADGATVPVRVEVDVPGGTPPGTYAVRATVGPRVAAHRAPTRSPTQLLVTIEVPGRLRPDARRPEVDLRLDVRWERPWRAVVDVRVDVTNPGPGDASIGGLLVLRSWDGDGASHAIPLARLPAGRSRVVIASWRQGPAVGPVTVTAEVVDQRGTRALRRAVTQATTWVVPWRLLGLAIGAVGAVVASVLVIGVRARHARTEGGSS